MGDVFSVGLVALIGLVLLAKTLLAASNALIPKHPNTKVLVVSLGADEEASKLVSDDAPQPALLEAGLLRAFKKNGVKLLVLAANQNVEHLRNSQES